MAPMRAPMKAQTSLPAAPPANTSVSESPMVGRLAPLAVSTNGRNSRKPMRVALSMHADREQHREGEAQPARRGTPRSGLGLGRPRSVSAP